MFQTAKIFQSGMVLQRDKVIKLWGQGRAGTVVSAKIQDQCGKTIVQQDGQWMMEIPPLTASECERMIICSGDEEIVLDDVAVGEVWVAGGQSNMEFQMCFEKFRNDEIKSCPQAQLRFFDVPEAFCPQQLERFDYSESGVWQKATAADLDHFSAVGYYFQKALQKSLGVPIGIIGCNWGGSPSCAWMSPSSAARFGVPWMEDYEKLLREKDFDAYLEEQIQEPMNDRSHPLTDPFTTFMMPRTPTPEEISAFFAQLGGGMSSMPEGLLPHYIPGILYEQMVKTIAPYSVRGVIWYQGESDDVPDRQNLYEGMLTAVIRDWRTLWQDDQLPFLIVQLPGFSKWLEVECLDYAAIRRCQEAVTKNVPNTWLCSISDAGEALDIHPKNKKVVGERLALLARGHVYGEPLLCDAPRAVSAKREGGKIIIQFENAGGGLTVKGERVNALEVLSGGTGLTFQAEACGETLVIAVDKEISSVKIDFAQGKWYLVNLYNAAGIPAIPFSVMI